MKEVFKNIAKTGVTMFAVGALLALAAPLIGMAVGIAPTESYGAAAEALGHSAKPLWMGAFFGAFGAIQAAVAPMLSSIFGGDKAKEETAEKEKAQQPRIFIALKRSPEQAIVEDKYREQIKAERETTVTRQL